MSGTVDASGTRLAYVTETTYGVTPATPAMQELRFTSENLNANIENIRSDEIRSDRSISDTIQVGSNTGGDINFELSYGTFDDFIESALQSSWVSDVIKNGVTQKSFTIEKTFDAATDQFHRFAGSIVDTVNLNVSAQEIVNGTFGMLAQGIDASQAPVTGATYTAAPTNDVMNAANDFANLTLTGVTTAPNLLNVTIDINNNLRRNAVIGSVDALCIGSGQFEVSGTLQAYFENEELYDRFLAGGESALSFEIGGSTNLKYQFAMNKIKFESGQVVAGGNNQDVLVDLTYVALADDTDGTTLAITRTP